MTTITLHDITGFSVKFGVDNDNNTWQQFEVDYFAEQQDGECSICGAVLGAGWLCLDGGDEVCNHHISFREE